MLCHQKISGKRVLTPFVCLTVLLLPDVCSGRIRFPRDPRDGVVDASLVVIVREEGKNVFRIEEVAFGEDRQAGDMIVLPPFRLVRYRADWPFVGRDDEEVEPITQNTRILLFLKLKSNEDGAGAFELTHHGHPIFWVHDPAKIGELRSLAEPAVNLRRSWDKARAIPDEAKRVEALWPYLWDHGGGFSRETREELEKTGAVAGDYFAERLPGMSRGDRMRLLADAGVFGGERLHAVLIRHLKQQQQAYDAFAETRGPGATSVIKNWSHTPPEIEDIRGEVYYGLAGLAKFRNQKDLPLVRELALWAVERDFIQTCETAIDAFGAMPDKANLPVLDAICKKFYDESYPGLAERLRHDVIPALHSHRFPETVPILAQLLGGHEDHVVRELLTDIVGKDLGPEPNVWVEWYQEVETGGKGMSPTDWRIFIPLPTDPKTASEQLQAVRRFALGKDKIQREWAVGTLLQQLPVGMPRENVEQWLGKGERERPETVETVMGGREDRIVLTYYCRFPNGPPSMVMTVHYETRGKLHTLVRVQGPHLPDH